jgi:phage-related holin
MLWVLAVIFIVLWLLGLITAHMFGGWLHILLVIAVIVIAIQLISGGGI